MRIFTVKGFDRDAELTDAALRRAISEIEAGLVDGRLGGSLVKKRIAGKGQGKRGGYRTIVAISSARRAFFLYCFAKNARTNITERELGALKALARELLSYSTDELNRAVERGALVEVRHNDNGT